MMDTIVYFYIFFVFSNSKMSSKMGYKKLTEFAFEPVKESPYAAGFDLKSAYDTIILKRSNVLVKTDLAIIVPENCYGRIAPRSGLALKNQICVGGGVIDRNYTGNVCVILFNHSDTDYTIKRGDKIAQLICEVIEYPNLYEVTELPATNRGSAGFGSTGR